METKCCLLQYFTGKFAICLSLLNISVLTPHHNFPWSCTKKWMQEVAWCCTDEAFTPGERKNVQMWLKFYYLPLPHQTVKHFRHIQRTLICQSHTAEKMLMLCLHHTWCKSGWQDTSAYLKFSLYLPSKEAGRTFWLDVRLEVMSLYLTAVKVPDGAVGQPIDEFNKA